MTTEDGDSRPKSVHNSLIVGIAGGSASGKTTFTAALQASFASKYPEVSLLALGMDRYFYRGAHGGPVFTSPTSGESLPNNNHPNSADNARLIADLQSMSTAPDAPDLIIVEGLMTLHVDELRALLDIKIFVELDADVRALRRLLRDMNGGRGNTDPAWIAQYYRECARVGHNAYVEPSRAYADLIIRGDSDFDTIAPIVAAAIHSKLVHTC
jgi:uridine kinase